MYNIKKVVENQMPNKIYLRDALHEFPLCF